MWCGSPTQSGFVFFANFIMLRYSLFTRMHMRAFIIFLFLLTLLSMLSSARISEFSNKIALMSTCCLECPFLWAEPDCSWLCKAGVYWIGFSGLDIRLYKWYNYMYWHWIIQCRIAKLQTRTHSYLKYKHTIGTSLSIIRLTPMHLLSKLAHHHQAEQKYRNFTIGIILSLWKSVCIWFILAFINHFCHENTWITLFNFIHWIPKCLYFRFHS